MSLITCKVCENEFDNQNPIHKSGYYGICGHCDPKKRKDVVRTIGMIVATGKTDQFTQIIKNPSKEIAAFVKRQGKCGPSQTFTSLGLNTSGATTSKANMDAVHEKLYEGLE